MDKTGIPPVEPEFDPVTATKMQTTASTKLQALLRTKQDAASASSSKEFAVRCVRGLETTIHQLFDVGASPQEVLSQLIEALPSIPVEDLRYALKALRTRDRKLRVSIRPSTVAADTTASAKKHAPQAATETHKETKPKHQADTAMPTESNTIGANLDLPAWADGSDKRADESDDDYRLRKEIEGPPEARQKFIGEH